MLFRRNKNIPTRFVMLFEGRVGSSFVVNSLNSHPEIATQDEILVNEPAEKQQELIEGLFASPKKPVVGFKTKYRDIADEAASIDLLKRYDVKIIYLYRKNVIKLALSRLNALRIFEKYGTWNRLEGQEPLPSFAPTIEAFEEALAFRKDKEEALQDFLARLDMPRLDMAYEALLEDQNAFFQNIFDYLGCKPALLTSQVQKNTSDNMRDVLLNYDELKAHYIGTEYASMWDE